jgi:multidrug transporter EmrE-like cation transporter
MALTWNTLMLLALAGINSTIGNMLIKRGRLLAEPGSGAIEKIFEINFIGGLFFYGVNLLLFAKALETAPVSSAYPVLAGIGFLGVALSSTYFFGEQVGMKEIGGMLLVVCGIWLLAK